MDKLACNSEFVLWLPALIVLLYVAVLWKPRMAKGKITFYFQSRLLVSAALALQDCLLIVSYVCDCCQTNLIILWVQSTNTMYKTALPITAFLILSFPIWTFPIWIFLLHFVHSCSQTTVFTQQSAFQGRRLANSPRPNGAAINQMVLLKESSKVRTLNMITLCKQYTDSFVYLCGVHFT